MRRQRICHLEGHTVKKIQDDCLAMKHPREMPSLRQNFLVFLCTSLDTTRPWDLSLKCRINLNIILPFKFSACSSKCNAQVKTKIGCWRCHVWLNTPEQNNYLLQTCRTTVDKCVLGWNTKMSQLFTVLQVCLTLANKMF